jgi:ectoine hydroxylase-related dioxygenase (phytanoyl-CoA dioxygenase family)
MKVAAILSDDEIAHYEGHGYVIPGYRLPAQVATELRDACDGLIRADADTRPEHLMNPHMLDWPGGSNPFLAVARNDAILHMVAQLIGPDLILWITRILCKPAGDGYEVPWHQDGQYWPIRPLSTCSVWIALDPASRANGCMRFIPGSHRRERLYRHRVIERDGIVLNQEVEPEEFDEDLAVDVELEPGEMSLHDVRMIHGSLANTSSMRRAGLILRYFAATSHFDRSVSSPANAQRFAVTDQPLFLVRGIDRCGRNDFEHGHAMWQERLAGIELQGSGKAASGGVTP